MLNQSKNFKALAGVDIEIGQTWFQHGQNMALACSQKVGTQ